jgi:phospholipase A1
MASSTWRPWAAHLLLCAGLLAGGLAQAQTGNAAMATAAPALGWQACQSLGADATAQLACFKAWADAQPAHTGQVAAQATALVVPEATQQAAAFPPLPSLNNEAPDGKKIGCRNIAYSELSRYWELQRGSDCDTFAIRGYRPISLSVIASDSVNTQPSSPSPGHTAATALPYDRTENRIQLSIRTKIARGLLTSGTHDEDNQDSLWFGYTQQSYWQIFNGALSRPFRSTDHEPELIYIYPHQIRLPGDWNYRLSGLGLVHQSNGQSLPLSRSWNRVYLMGAAEKDLGGYSRLGLQARIWQRLRESAADDDNPGISDYIGRAELSGHWQINKVHSLGMTVRHSLQRDARGSVRLEWMKASTSVADSAALRYHVQLFSGYGDSLIDYNRRRNVLSVGLSLVDW